MQLTFDARDDIASAASVNAARTIARAVTEVRAARVISEQQDSIWPEEPVHNPQLDAVLIGHMEETAAMVKRVAKTNVLVLLLGDSGTGKEIVARAVHEYSDRAGRPFIPVNCAALPGHLLESTLFGYNRGAFTGADRDNPGLIRAAAGGTLFLDEIGELGLELQPKLLRFLESGEIRKVGDNEPFRVDVRVLCATNRDLRRLIQEDGFREDLFFRINTFEIRLPPLRERRSDIPDLARHLLGRAARRPPEQVADLLSPEAVDLLLEHEWPGNVRELANVMEHAYIIAGGGRITPEHLPHTIRTGGPATLPMKPPAASGAAPAPAEAAPPRTLSEIEMEHVLRVLEKHGGSKTAAAAELGISLKTMYNKLNKLQEERKSAG
jgi:transcriptional regulator with PAS, ATPase and Fis domain